VRRVNLLVMLGFVVITVLVTYPQAVHIATSVPFHSDPYFSMWRLAWVARTIVRDPMHLFEANIFYPAHDTLGYSDAMLLPAVVLAPLSWIKVNPVAVYNATLLVALIASAYAAYRLAYRLTGHVVGSFVAGVIYGFAPYRFTHYMHLELQFVFWMPIALILIHRIIERGRLLDGLTLGLVMVAQLFSSVYAAIFLALYCALLAVLVLAFSEKRGMFPQIAAAVFIAGGLTLASAVPYAHAYAQAEQSVGSRSMEDVRRYSATVKNYLQASPINRLYSATADTDIIYTNEMNLFPGFLALALAALGVASGSSRMRLVYLAMLIFAFDLSRGANSVVYPLLYHYLRPFRGLRSPARIGILVNLSLGVLAAYGAAWVLSKPARPEARTALMAAILSLFVVEYASLPELSRAATPSQVDAWLARQPPVVIVELPLGTRDWEYMYQGIGHFQKMLNGYSGFTPESYKRLRESMESFPDDRSIALLRHWQVDYIIVRGGLLEPSEWRPLIARLRARSELSHVVTFSENTDAQAVFALRR